MRNSPRGFIKTAGRGSAYCTKGGAFWIVKVRTKWHLVRMGNRSEGVEQCTVGKFATLAEAGAFYWENETAGSN